MRIVYLLTSLGMGGAERQVLSIAERMKARGHTVALMVLRPPLAEEWQTALGGVRLGIERKPLSVLRGIFAGRRFLRQFAPDLVHSHSFHANFVARMLRLVTPGIAVVSTVHNVYEGDGARMLAYRLTDGLSCRTTTVSTAAAERFVALKAVPRRKCSVLTNGIDIAEFTPNAERRLEMRARMSVAAEFVWLTAGRIVAAKDYPNLLEAFARLRLTHTDARLWIAGDTAGIEFERVSRLAAQLKLEEAIRWLGLRRDLPALLDAADGFVLGSAWEGMPLVVGEAMAMAKPLLATDVGGVRELMGETGAVVAAKDSEALAAAMQAMMQRTDEDRRTLGLAARERIEKHFSIDAKTVEWETLYRAVLESAS